jgi:hypothetical protein
MVPVFGVLTLIGIEDLALILRRPGSARAT